MVGWLVDVFDKGLGFFVMPGYDLKIDGEYARLESLLCSSCELILRDAIQNEEGLRFCKTCWETLRYVR